MEAQVSVPLLYLSVKALGKNGFNYFTGWMEGRVRLDYVSSALARLCCLLGACGAPCAMLEGT